MNTLTVFRAAKYASAGVLTLKVQTHTHTHTLLTDEHLRNYKKNCGTMVHLINSCSPKGYFTCWL